MSDEPILEGDLSRIALPDVLGFVSMVRGTGKLVIRNEKFERTMIWKDGEIVFAQSNSPEHSLGQFLLRNGKITAQQYEESRQKITPAMRHGKVLVQMGALSPKDLWWGVKNQALEIIYSTFHWDTGRFSFYEDTEELSSEKIVLQLNASTVIMEGVRRIDETARIREKITGPEMVFAQVAGVVPDFDELDMNEAEVEIYNNIDGKLTVRDLIGKSELTEFEVTRILFQLLSARLVEPAPEPSEMRQVFLDVEDSPELLKIISVYNGMFGKLFISLDRAVGEEAARDIFMNTLQSSDTDDLWTGVFFDQDGRFDENMLIANISELPLDERKSVLDEGLNTLLSVELFEVSQHLDAAGKVDIFRFISDQKAALEQMASA